VILTELRSGTGDTTRWPSDQDLTDFYMNNDAYYRIQVARLTMALGAVERSLYTNKTDILGVPRTLSVEHIIPQKWEAHWPLRPAKTVEQEEAHQEERLKAIHRLGNLTIVTKPLNSGLSNDTWEKKQKGLNEHSKLLLNSRLITDYPKTFDEAGVQKRTKWLAERFCHIWAGPDAKWPEVG
jgi:hypothetical protein